MSIKVVKFIVNVKLVLNNANSSVGSVIVVKVIVQTNIPGKALSPASSPCPSIASHETASAAPPAPAVPSTTEARIDCVAVLARKDVRLVRLREAEREGLREEGVMAGGGGGAWWT